MSILIIDPSLSGASGDLLISALLDLQNIAFRTTFCNIFQKSLKEFDPNFRVSCEYRQVQGFKGCYINITTSKKLSTKEMLSLIQKLGKKIALMDKTIELSITTLECLIDAEKMIHGIEKDDNHIHFHELASIDTIFDIVGFFYLWEKMALSNMKIFILPIAVGGGSTHIEHGLIPIPAPVTLEIIKRGNLVIKGGPLMNGELLTPTGAAILTVLKAKPINYLPLMQIEKIGRSTGTREYNNKLFPLLQIIQGSELSSFKYDDIITLETNVDDVDGETLGYLFELLFDEQKVLDLSIINTLSKKNRPGFLIRAIVEPSKSLEVTKILVRELGTLGIRILPGYRHIASRKQEIHQIKLKNEKEKIHIKKGFLDSEEISEKIEFEDIKRIARKNNIPLHKIRRWILSEIYKQDDNDAGY